MLFRKLCSKSYYTGLSEGTLMFPKGTGSLDDCIDLCAAYNLLQPESGLFDGVLAMEPAGCGLAGA